MKRFLVAALAAGLVYALLGPIFVHFVLDEGMQQELSRVVGQVLGKAPVAVDAAGGSDWGQFALQIVVRLLFGGLTAAVLGVLLRRRPRPRAARLAGGACWLLGYVAWPVVLAVGYGLSTLLLFVAIGYGLVETQLAAHVAALAWGRPGGPPK